MPEIVHSYVPANILQRLIRFDTTNPPGNEAACIAYLNGLLTEAGIATTLLEREPGRPNLIARLAGRGDSPPLLLQGHVDVVTTAGQQWRYPPFEGRLAEGMIWGRGALDMKGGVAMLVTAFLRAHQEELNLPGDVILALMPDEEKGSACGAKFLVEDHAGLFAGVRYALGEFGAVSTQIGLRRCYPIMVAERQYCGLRAIVRGPGGHGSIRQREGILTRLTRVLNRINMVRLPVHITPVTRRFVESFSQAQPFPLNVLMAQLLNPALTGRILDLVGPMGTALEAMLYNTAVVTAVHGGDGANVIPSEVELRLDGRVLPGFGPAELLAELQAVVGDGVAFEVVTFEPGPAEPDMALFGMLAGILRESDPEGVPMPMLITGVTDGRFFAQLGIQTYGFTPLKLPADMNFTALLHAADERVPAEALEFGARAIYTALGRF
ncbi:MAG: M20/M25/M40 family metallo-hydrolase [Chloroflexaceae bacterium]|nr:M20/M25/M40 family metallo-hydrolase [Chloroflexaceae bacterium]